MLMALFKVNSEPDKVLEAIENSDFDIINVDEVSAGWNDGIFEGYVLGEDAAHFQHKHCLAALLFGIQVHLSLVFLCCHADILQAKAMINVIFFCGFSWYYGGWRFLQRVFKLEKHHIPLTGKPYSNPLFIHFQILHRFNGIIQRVGKDYTCI